MIGRFFKAMVAARFACAAVYGPRWDLHPEATMWVRLPPHQDRPGRPRGGYARRDYKVPVAKFWAVDPNIMLKRKAA